MNKTEFETLFDDPADPESWWRKKERRPLHAIPAAAGHPFFPIFMRQGEEEYLIEVVWDSVDGPQVKCWSHNTNGSTHLGITRLREESALRRLAK